MKTKKPVSLTIVEATVERLVNKGNYENEKLSIKVKIREGEDPKRVVFAARKWVFENLGLVERAAKSKSKTKS